MIHLDTSFLIRASARGTPESAQLKTWLARRLPVRISAVAWAEFLSGPVSVSAMELAAELFGEPRAFSGLDATLAARLYNVSGRRRGTLVDCMIAASAINASASLATCNRADFERLLAFGLSFPAAV